MDYFYLIYLNKEINYFLGESKMTDILIDDLPEAPYPDIVDDPSYLNSLSVKTTDNILSVLENDTDFQGRLSAESGLDIVNTINRVTKNIFAEISKNR